MIERFETVDSVAAWREGSRHAGERVALVPTMGALHDGHLSLIDVARGLADRVVVSVFVNPTQFGPGEDFEAYPRDLSRDAELAEGRGAHAVFAPGGDEMYPEEQTIWVEPGPLADRLCGLSRPGHFRGVLTIVAKLFATLRPDAAVFGRKDFQQSVLVRRMNAQLAFGVEIATAPIVREPDGLALSSRNAYLSADEREVALSLSAALRAARYSFAHGEREPHACESGARAIMESAGADVEYVSVVEPAGLEPPVEAEARHVMAIAARVGTTRLIDNETLGESSPLDGFPRRRSSPSPDGEGG